jgi:uncharacterized membrane protein
MTIAAIEIHFLGQHGEAWWALVVLVLGAALLGHGILQLRRSGRKGRPGGRPDPENNSLVSLAAGAAAVVFAVASVLLPDMRSVPVALAFTTATVGLTIWLFYKTVYRYLGKSRMAILFALRLLAAIFLLLLLFQPVLALVHRPHHIGTLGVVIDASGSMSVNDAPNQPSRYLQSTLGAKMLIKDLRDQFHVLCFAYDGKHNGPLTSPRQWNSIAPDGTMTDLPTAIKMATNSGATAVVLFSDGIQNGPSKIGSLRHLGVPVYTVRVGSTSAKAAGVPQIEIVRIDGPQTAPVDTQVTLTAIIRSTSLNDRTVRVFLDHHKKPLQSHRLVLHSGRVPQSVKLEFTPHHVGRMVLHVRIPVLPEERSTAGNEQEFPMLITNPKIRMLYIEGRVRPEVGPLYNDLAMNPNISLVSLIRTRPGYFMIRGSAGGKTLTGLPTTLKQWERFKVIMLGDVSADFLSPQQQSDLQQAVQHGAGFIMIGGQRNFAVGGWGESRLAPVFPVHLQMTTPAQLSEAFVPQLTAFGAASPILQGITGWFTQANGKPAPQHLPDLEGCVAFAGAKPGATVLLTNPAAQVDGKPAIVLAVQHYGKGRSAAFAGDTTYRWRLILRTLGAKSPYQRFWGQLVNWLAGQSKTKTSNGPSVTAMIRKQRYQSNETVRLRVAVTDMHGQSTRYAHVHALITNAAGKTRTVRLHAEDRQPGMYKRNIMPHAMGQYHVVFTATMHGHRLGQDSSDFYVTSPGGEMDKLAAEPTILQRIARLTGGSYAELAGINALARRIQAAQPPGSTIQRTSYPLYDNKAFFLLFIAALSCEWFLRRKWQLQ